jgi:hypothetical protein
MDRLAAQAQTIETLSRQLQTCREDSARQIQDLRLENWRDRARASHAEDQLVTLQARYRALQDDFRVLQKTASEMKGEILRYQFASQYGSPILSRQTSVASASTASVSPGSASQ